MINMITQNKNENIIKTKSMYLYKYF